ncbi:MAG TPA: CPBP family intramembrane metalloprotease domain-containing protein [Anaerolineaceae bacterium]|nr:CPBP family intramembrane metalloprotease domain-containing protein [Anaerolineaceae bacterium]
MDPLNKRRIKLFLAFAFGISWLTALVIYLTGGLLNSPIVIESGSITLAYILLASVYMWGPAIANVATRLITKEGKNDLKLKLNFRKDWRYVLAAWVGTPVLVLLGTALFFLLFPDYFDPNLSILTSQLALSGSDTSTASVYQIVIMQVLYAIVASPIMNLVSTFGEEFGWRGYLLPKLLPLGKTKAILLQGVIWGVWHWPVILMGYNYGFDYPGSPWLGPLAMVWFTVLVGIFLAWLTLKTDSVWPANIAHGALNGIASIGVLFLVKNPPVLLGPYPTGVIGSIPFLLIGILVFLFAFPKEKIRPIISAN